MGAAERGISAVELVAGPFVLRPPARSDADESLRMLQDLEIVRWFPAPAVVDLETAREWCERGADWSSGTHATFSVIDPNDQRLVGNVTLGSIDLSDQLDAAVAYRTAPWARRRGVASSAVDAVTRWAFDVLGVERIRLEHSLGNPASCGVALRCRYVCEGVMRQGHRDAQGVRHDAHLHARLRSDLVDHDVESS